MVSDGGGEIEREGGSIFVEREHFIITFFILLMIFHFDQFCIEINK